MKNLQLRERLNQLHETYNRVVEEKNREITTSYRTEPRKSGLGSTRVLSEEESQRYYAKEGGFHTGSSRIVTQAIGSSQDLGYVSSTGYRTSTTYGQPLVTAKNENYIAHHPGYQTTTYQETVNPTLNTVYQIGGPATYRTNETVVRTETVQDGYTTSYVQGGPTVYSNGRISNQASRVIEQGTPYRYN